MDVTTKITGDQQSAAEFMQAITELEGAITTAGISISAGDLTQVAKTLAVYAAGADFYTESGAADAYVLSIVGAKLAPPAYFTGMKIKFRAANKNTGASTVNVASLGVKNIRLQDGSSDPILGQIRTDRDTWARYNGTSFILITPDDNTPAFKAERITSTQTLTVGVLAKLQINSTIFDTHTYYDPTVNYRYTPLIAGEYFVSANIAIVGDVAASPYEVAIYKNGAQYFNLNEEFNGVSANSVNSSIGHIVDMNGSTDYIELFGIMNAPSTVANMGLKSTFSAFKLGI